MNTGQRLPHGDEGDPLAELATERTWRFDAGHKGGCQPRAAAAGWLSELARSRPPRAPDAGDDVLLVVTELANNACSHAPGPISLTLRDTGDGVHIALGDSSPVPPYPRRIDPSDGRGLGWRLIQALADEIIVVPEGDGKTVHAFLPW